ncbi:hypothetical protein [Spiroplasma endosymbiont of Amphimallon solstitiale]|uniref:hypothetical protein n=1 Tax=Spiroplasma endosymbiont of Amphimallon solstitiale TaxID=3066288 RepID=UPI00313B4ABD
MTKRFGYNLLAFVYFSNQRRGTAKLVLKKSTCKRIIKIYKKNKNLQISDKVRLLSNFLSSNIVSKISVLAEESFNYVEKYGWPKIIHQFTLKILFLIKNLLKVTLFSVKIL